MVLFDKDTFDPLKHAFIREFRRVEPYSRFTSTGEPKVPRRKLTEDLQLREEYKKELVKTYNDIIDYLHSVFEDAQSQAGAKSLVKAAIGEILTKLKDSFVTLNLSYEFESDIFAHIDLNKITEDPIDDSTDNNSDLDKNTDTHTPTSSTGGDLESDKSSETSQKGDTDIQTLTDNTDKQTQLPQQQILNNSEQIQDQTVTMPQSKLEFLQACHAAIDYKYDGAPTGLGTFLDAVDLLGAVVEDDNKPTLIKFIMTRLEGKAREAIIKTPKETEEFGEQLRKAIKFEPSKVILGRILALRAERTNLNKFSDRAEELAEQYRLSLVAEGFEKEKAKELAVEKITELCVSQSRHDRIKSILLAKTFKEPEDVTSKMIIEINSLRLESAQNSHKNSNSNQNRSGKNYNNKHSNGKNYNGNSNQNRGNSNNRSGQSNGNGYKQNYNNGNSRGNGQNYSQNSSRTFTNSGSQRRSTDQTVRSFLGNQATSGNGGDTHDNN